MLLMPPGSCLIILTHIVFHNNYILDFGLIFNSSFSTLVMRLVLIIPLFLIHLMIYLVVEGKVKNNVFSRKIKKIFKLNLKLGFLKYYWSIESYNAQD